MTTLGSVSHLMYDGIHGQYDNHYILPVPQGRMTIGRASVHESDFFIGNILGVKVFDQVLSPTGTGKPFDIETLPESLFREPSGPRMTEDGRICLSPCTPSHPSVPVVSSISPRPAIVLSCTDSLFRPEFNGHTDKKYLVFCGPGCLYATSILEGCKSYSSRSSVCKAGLHSGVILEKGGYFLVTVREGLTDHSASRGHYGKMKTT